MMYNQKFVVAVKSGGRILREVKDAVYITFGSEYSIVLKNLNSMRAIVNVEVDGTNITPSGIIVNANEEVELQRSLANGNLEKGNALKFIERTKSIEDGPRGIKMDDGLIRVSFNFEKVVHTVTTTTNHIHHDVHHYPYRWPYYHRDCCGSPVYGGLLGGQTNVYTSNMSDKTMIGAVNCANTISAQGMTFNATSASAGPLRGLGPDVKSFSDTGITVPGSESDQKFKMVSSFPTEAEQHVMVLRLLGEDPRGVEVTVPVTVKAKPKCVTCGRNNKAHSKFCVACGTALEII